MPPKRNFKLKKETRKRNTKIYKENGSAIKKQKSSIESRLMKISLIVDDYIYKGTPITARNAALFLKEVSRYRDQCFGDRRSLQVIERLERGMKDIIQEEQELHGCNSDITNSSWKDNPGQLTSNLTNTVIGKPTTNVVYNNHVENDLSWIEDLRYVREITEEEKIPLYYEDSFWESYSLPIDWNDDAMFQSIGRV